MFILISPGVNCYLVTLGKEGTPYGWHTITSCDSKEEAVAFVEKLQNCNVRVV